MMKGVAIVVVAFSWLNIAAQQKAPLFLQLSGRVTDTAGVPLSKATVQLTEGVDTLTTLSSDNGIFVFPHVRPGTCRLIITMNGYLSFSHSYSTPEGKLAMTLPSISLCANYSELDPVTVTGLRPITIHEDTTSYNVVAFPVRDGSEVEDILKRLPGVEVDINGNVIIAGKPLSKVLVDGKEFFGSNVLLAIQNLPADIVDKIQVIDDYGDKARLTGVKSGDAGKVLNIVLKVDKRNGLFGRAGASGGTQEKYTGDAFANAFNGDRQLSANTNLSNNSPAGADAKMNDGVSYADQWSPRWGGALNVNYSNESQHAAISVNQLSYYPGEQLQQVQNNNNTARNSNASLESRLICKPDAFSILRLSVSGSLEEANNQILSKFSAIQSDSGYTKSSNGVLQNNTHSTGQALNSDIYFEKLSSNSRRRFSLDGGLGYSGGKALNNTQSAGTIVVDSSMSPSQVNYQTFNYSRNWVAQLAGNYFMPLTLTSFLELGYRMKSVTSWTDVVTNRPDSGTSGFVEVDSLSQNMILHNLTQDIHAAFTGKFYPFDITAGIDAQPGDQVGNVSAKTGVISYSYFVIIPNLQAAYTIGKGKRLNLLYNSQPNLPSIQQLIPFTNVTNPQYPVTGNPDLKPSYTDNLALQYEQSSLGHRQFTGFGVGLTYSSTRHSIIQNLSSPRVSSQIIQATTYLNAGTTDNLSAAYHVSLPAFLHKRLRINITGSAGRSQTITMSDSIQYLNQVWNFNQSIHLQLLIPNVIESDLTGTYSLTDNTYSATGSPKSRFQSAGITLKSRHYFRRQWILSYELSQPYTTNGSRLQTDPASLNASLQWQLLRHNSGAISLMGCNLLNQSTAKGQSVSPTTITESRPELTGRYFLLGFEWKIQRFH